MVIKQCLKKGICGKVYREGDDGYELNYCKLCGAPLEEKETKGEDTAEDTKTSQKSDDFQGKKPENIFVDKYGYVHLSESEMNKVEKSSKFVVYNDDVISGIVKVDNGKVTVNNDSLGIILNEKSLANCNSIEEVISVYSEKGEYYIEKVSENGLVSINGESIPNGKSTHIGNGEIIVLSSNNWIEFEIN